MKTELLDMPAHEYHADRVGSEVPTLSASIAGTLVRKSPRHAWLSHPRLGGKGRVRKSTDEQAQGTLIHAMVLGKGMDQVRVIDAKDYRTKAAQEARDAAEAEGFTPILAAKLAPMQRTAGGILAAMEAAGVVLDGVSEAVMTWTENTAAGPVACRGMTDHIILNRGTIIDLKTCHSAHPKACESHVIEWGYDVQRAAYLSALGKLRPEWEGRATYKWVFAEIDGGDLIDVVVAEASGMMREIGAARWRRACETWAVCLRDDYWPGYGDAVLLDAPPWAVKEELGL